MTVKSIRRTTFILLLVPLFVSTPGHSAVRQNTASHATQSGRHTQIPDTPLPQDHKYVIGDDDLLEINVWKEPTVTQPSLLVRSDGNITIPLIGTVMAAGRTPSQLANSIAAKLRTYIQHPIVTVMVLQSNSRKFNILGRVVKPGSYALLATTRVLDAIAEAGGFTDFAKRKRIYILRQESGGREVRIPFNYNEVIQGRHSEENVLLAPHDTVVVP
jgi:polysaccharide export outer membrane protein